MNKRTILSCMDGGSRAQWRNVLRVPPCIPAAARQGYVFISIEGSRFAGQPALLSGEEVSGSGRSSSGQKLLNGGLEKGGAQW